MRSNILRFARPDPIYQEPRHEQTTMRSKRPSASEPNHDEVQYIKGCTALPIYKEPKHKQATMRSKPLSASEINHDEVQYIKDCKAKPNI